MYKFATKFKATTTSVVIGVFIWALTMLTDVEVFEVILEFLESLEHYELDEIVIALALLLIGITIDSVAIKRQREQRAEVFQQRLHVLHTTMRTVQDIVGNFLNQLQLFQMQAKKCQDFPPESIKELNSMIHDTAEKLKIIGDLEDTPEIEISAGLTMIDVATTSPERRKE